MFRTNPAPKDLIPELDTLAAGATSSEELMNGIVALLHKSLLKYNWVGFYMIQKEGPGEDVLILGPFKGSMTPHTRIQLNQGICGAAASSGKTVVVDDVSADSRTPSLSSPACLGGNGAGLPARPPPRSKCLGTEFIEFAIDESEAAGFE